MKVILQTITILSLIFVISACSDYQRVVKSGNYEEKFEYANRMFNDEKYDKALALYEQIYQRSPKSDQGEVSYYRMGMSFFNMENFFMSRYYFTQFVARFPNSDNREKAFFLSAMSAVKDSPSISLDQTETEQALNDLQTFTQTFPRSKYIDSANRSMDRLRLKLETKQLNTVRLYDKMEDYRAAVAAAYAFLEEYPSSNNLPELSRMLFDNSYHLGMESILSKKKERIEDALNVYAKYQGRFGKRSFEKRAERRKAELEAEIIHVDEQYAYSDIKEAFHLSNSSSKSKKVNNLKETIKRFHNFAEKYPDSDLLEKARTYQKRAERELKNLS